MLNKVLETIIDDELKEIEKNNTNKFNKFYSDFDNKEDIDGTEYDILSFTIKRFLI